MNDKIKKQLLAMLDDNNPTGDLICQNGTFQYYWSNIQWTNPRYALIAHPEEWLNLGTDGWWSGPEQKELFKRVELMAADMWPTHPGEWCRLDDVKQTVSYWKKRALKAERALQEMVTPC